jgi:hypothetical protein
MSTRNWHKGPPPHVGWWNASVVEVHDAWRWWNGEFWSNVVYSAAGVRRIEERAAQKFYRQKDVRWTDYYPRNARVPRIDPARLQHGSEKK